MMMMSSLDRRVGGRDCWGLPEKQNVAARENIRIYNDLVALIVEKNNGKRGFLRSETLPAVKGGKSVALNFIDVLRDVLWTIDGHHATLARATWSVPPLFLLNGPYFNRKTNRSKPKTLDRDVVAAKASALGSVCQQAFLDDPIWAWLREPIKKLAESLDKYKNHLGVKSTNRNALPNSMFPARNPRENSDTFTLRLVSVTPVAYRKVKADLMQKDLYEALDLLPYKGDMYAVAWQRWKENMCFDVPTRGLKYDVGSNIGSFMFVGRIGHNEGDEQRNKELALVDSIRQNLPQFETRAAQNALVKQYSFIQSLSPSSIRLLYERFTGHKCASVNNVSRELMDRIELVLSTENPQRIVDYGVGNRKNGGAYNAFLSKVQAMMNDKTGAGRNRKGTTSYLSRVLSLRVLYEKAKGQCPDGEAIPSKEWLRLQFVTQSKHSHQALNFTGVLKARYTMQRRNHRENNKDAPYAAWIRKTVRQFALLLQQVMKKYNAEHGTCYAVVYASEDDKAILVVGEPGMALNPGIRQRRHLTHDDDKNDAGDHDTSRKLGEVITVNVAVTMPRKISGSWYGGQAFHNVHNSAFDPSSLFRNDILTKKILEVQGAARKCTIAGRGNRRRLRPQHVDDQRNVC